MGGGPRSPGCVEWLENLCLESLSSALLSARAANPSSLFRPGPPTPVSCPLCSLGAPTSATLYANVTIDSLGNVTSVLRVDMEI